MNIWRTVMTKEFEDRQLILYMRMLILAKLRWLMKL